MVDATQVGLQYLQLAHHIRRTVDDQLAADGVSLSRLKLLQAIDRLEPVNQARLAEELAQAPRSITQALESLQRDHLIRRHPSPTDARSNLVTLTPAGRTTLTTALATGNTALHNLFTHLSHPQLTALRSALTTLESALLQS
ncbi:winged helix-turn-helix transcriptional regulator [Kribbella sandramycini]|uniref:DNA-binding MarR family transcriptional regulator n=1 Tax=Kribbella sandramycini TaxID=60450 RepID=A0A7Y4L9D1_9ACTN|nr:MarR family winged helix-turn-helix transcriptional regulator [Kribbella sandramycini]MBB6568848.1 DNA-binding MarR family transcriptional regulator [Kribbella sandramycini]NOL45616.1 winged helix-turn-helix transcriptional regulator [Kribbella sandramycini]